MKKIILVCLGFFAVCLLSVSIWVYLLLAKLPDVSVLKHYRPPAATEVVDKNGSVLTHFYERKFRIWTPIASLPDIVIEAVVTAEDDTFFAHHGVNYKATWDALVLDVEKGRFARGGSTITQQMIKNVLLSKEKTITRKLREYVLARRAEEILTKRKILEIYLNEVEWGDDIYGIEAASRYYLDKHASEMSVAEAALLAGMLPNPRYYNPFKRLDKAKHRQEQVLFNMQQAKLISQDEYREALDAPIHLRQEKGGKFEFTALSGGNGRPCWQHVLEDILDRFFDENTLYRSGITIRTNLDKSLQEELRAWEESMPEKPEVSDKIAVVKEGDVIRALSCAVEHEQELRSRFDLTGIFPGRYDVTIVDSDSISRDQILQPELDSETSGSH